MKSNERKHGRGSALSPNKEEKMKRSTNCPRGRPTMRSPLLNIVVAFVVLVAFGAMFSTDATGINDADDKKNFRDFSLDVVSHYESENDEEKAKSSVLAGINFGNIPGNFGDVPFALLGVLTPAIAIRRRRDSFSFSRFKPKDLQFLGLAMTCAIFGVIMLASGFAIAVSLTPLVAVGGTAILLMTAKKPEFAFAMSTPHDDAGTDRLSIACAALNEYDKRRLDACIEGFRLVSGKGKNAIEAKKTRFLELCSADVVDQAFKKVFGDAK